MKIPPRLKKAAKKFRLTPRETEIIAGRARRFVGKNGCGKKLGFQRTPSISTSEYIQKSFRPHALRRNRANLLTCVATRFGSYSKIKFRG